MRKKILIISLGAFCAVQVVAQNHDDHHEKKHSQTKAATVKVNKKFSVDQDLKTRMEAILNTMQDLHKSSKGQPSEKQLQESSKKLVATVNDIFKTCKLEPQADAAIHPLLADILAGAKLFEQNQFDQGHDKIHNALLAYEDLFKHPGWKHSKND